MKLMQDFPANPIEQPDYELEWNHEIDGPKLGAGKRLPYYLPHWSSREQAVPNFIFQDCALVLQITEESIVREPRHILDIGRKAWP